jgi:hypothetical protein
MNYLSWDTVSAGSVTVARKVERRAIETITVALTRRNRFVFHSAFLLTGRS